MDKSVISTSRSPRAIGPYSQAVRSGNLVFVSGQVALDPASGRFIEDLSIVAQTRRTLENLKGILSAAGLSMEDVVKVTVYLADMNDFKAMNAVYGEYFASEPPARAAVQVAALPLGAAVEIDCIAVAG
jgi:2-iminobutanoate/2-iminopropanoate deaminase